MPRALEQAARPPESVADRAGVSRETLERLAAHVALLRRWQRRVNLVSAATLSDVWGRHVLDSLQLVAHLRPEHEVLVDLGSGAGFPGLVVAIASGRMVHLIESDTRKCAFLREAIRRTEAPAVVHAVRIESAPPVAADLVMARALAPLPRLLGYAARIAPRHGPPPVEALFLKGAHVDAELTEATKYWTMSVQRLPSATDAAASLLRVHGYARRGEARLPPRQRD